MIAAIPPVFAATLLLGALSFSAIGREETDASGSLARDMLRHHLHHVAAAEASGLGVGPVDAPLPGVMQPMMTWHSEVVLDGVRRMVITWATDHPGALSAEVHRRALRKLERVAGGRVSIGLVSRDAFGDAFVDGAPLPATSVSIPDGAPVILRLAS